MAGWTVLGICGSLRRGSYNAALLDLVDELSEGARVVGADLAGRLPLFDPDVENDEAAWPDAVREFRARAEEAEGVVIATPEYAHGPAGVTKNALDWLVGSGGLVGRPTLLVSASPGQAGGMRAHPAHADPDVAGFDPGGLCRRLACGGPHGRVGALHRPGGRRPDAVGGRGAGGGTGIRGTQARARSAVSRLTGAPLTTRLYVHA